MPNYTVSQLTTVGDCDAVLNIAAQEQEDLNWKKLSIERQKEQYSESSVGIAAELAAKEAELQVVNTIISGLPEGTLKLEQEKRKMRLEYSIFLLNNRKTNYGDVAVIEKEFDLQRVERQLEETTALMNEVEARKAAI